VVGYTDAHVATTFALTGFPSLPTVYAPVAVARHIHGLEAELAAIAQPQPDRR
jgi:hypothetical protein